MPANQASRFNPLPYKTAFILGYYTAKISSISCYEVPRSGIRAV